MAEPAGASAETIFEVLIDVLHKNLSPREVPWFLREVPWRGIQGI